MIVATMMMMLRRRRKMTVLTHLHYDDTYHTHTITQAKNQKNKHQKTRTRAHTHTHAHARYQKWKIRRAVPGAIWCASLWRSRSPLRSSRAASLSSASRATRPCASASRFQRDHYCSTENYSCEASSLRCDSAVLESTERDSRCFRFILRGSNRAVLVLESTVWDSRCFRVI